MVSNTPVLLEDPLNLSGPPIYAWEGVGSSAWWHCRLCNARAEAGHIASEKHKKNWVDYKKWPATWVAHLAWYGEEKHKPDSPQVTLERAARTAGKACGTPYGVMDLGLKAVQIWSGRHRKRHRAAAKV